MHKIVVTEILAFLLGRKYYANIINTKEYTEQEWLIDEARYKKMLCCERCNLPWHEGFTQAEMFNLKKI